MCLFISECIPKYYDYFPETNVKGAILLTELLGENFLNLRSKFKHFSTSTVIRVGLQLVSHIFILSNKLNKPSFNYNN